MKYIWITLFLGVSPFVFGQQWEYGWKEASKKAAENNQNIILVFSGSDWCAPCIKLEKNIWESEEFQQYAKDHWVMLRADFPRKKGNKLPEAQVAENARLAEKYNQNGFFPYVVVLNAKGEVKGTTGFKNTTPKDYIALLKDIED